MSTHVKWIFNTFFVPVTVLGFAFFLSAAGEPRDIKDNKVLSQNKSDFSVEIIPGKERDAFKHVLWHEIPKDLWTVVREGRSLTHQTWVISPTLEKNIGGLGPTYNRPSCLSCHPLNGRGEAPATSDEPMRGMLVRLSISGKGDHGSPNPEPRYGDQLNELGVPGVPGEGEAYLTWQTRVERLADGVTVELRQPDVAFRRLAFGEMQPGTMTSVRIAPPIYGLGLLEAVPESTIAAIAEAQKKEGRGVAGKMNRVFDPKANKVVLGRFGWKSNQPSTRQQLVGALAGDMGITSTVKPRPNCPPAQKACAAWSRHNERHPEISDADLEAMTLYHYALAIPAPRNTSAPKVMQGKKLFEVAGCASCHLPDLQTGTFDPFPALSNRTIHPYTDLLLHDMGEELADHRPDYLADGRQWRTPPLWGIGLVTAVNGTLHLMHDGRARTFLEAILWHGGEGEYSRNAVRQMNAADREALLLFLEAL